MRRLLTASELLPGRTTKDALRWAKELHRIQGVGRAVYAVGSEPVTTLDRARADVLRSGREARGHLAGVLHELDAVELDDRPTRRDRLADDRVVILGDVRCADGLQTLVDLAASLDDLTWEQALESALRKRLTTVEALEASLPILGAARVPGTARIRRVLALRLPGAPATESLLETLMVQLGRGIEGLGDFVRQHQIWDGDRFIARVDLARPDIGYFLELDGEGHKGQPVYDAVRQTNVVTATGMLVGRFTWTEVTRMPNTTRRRLAALHAKALSRREVRPVVPELPGCNPSFPA